MRREEKREELVCLDGDEMSEGSCSVSKVSLFVRLLHVCLHRGLFLHWTFSF